MYRSKFVILSLFIIFKALYFPHFLCKSCGSRVTFPVERTCGEYFQTYAFILFHVDKIETSESMGSSAGWKRIYRNAGDQLNLDSSMCLFP